MNKKQEIITESILFKIRSLQNISEKNKDIIKEDTDKNKKIISITNDPKFGENVLQSQEEAFKNAVNSGTVFADENENDPTSNPLVFLPKESNGNNPSNIVFSGTIPSMSNLKFQFKLNEPSGNGCFVWVDGLPLSDDNMKTLNKLYGYYLNWKDQWNSDIGSLDKIFNNKE